MEVLLQRRSSIPPSQQRLSVSRLSLLLIIPFQTNVPISSYEAAHTKAARRYPLTGYPSCSLSPALGTDLEESVKPRLKTAPLNK